MLNSASAELSMKEVSKFCQYFKIYKKTKFMLSWVKHEKRFITSGPDYL